MLPELIQLSSMTMIAVVAVVFVLAAAVVIFLLVRSGAGRRQRESGARERMLEIEREAQFAAAADRVTHSRNLAEVMDQVAALLREYLSAQVQAVYAGRETDSTLSKVSSKSTVQDQKSSRKFPDSVSASLLRENTRPVLIGIAAIAGNNSDNSSSADDATPQPGIASAESATFNEGRGRGSETGPGDIVLLLPWHGPFSWSGLIVASAPLNVPVQTLEPYIGSLKRLTDRIAIALELEAFDQRASRTTSFSRALISCLEESAPLDGIVREVRELVGSDSAALWRVDESSSMVRMVAAHGLKSPEFLPLPLGQGLAGSVAQSGEMLGIEDAPSDPRCIFPREARESGIVSYLGAPLAADGKLLGTIE